jgi:hypothetical protein
MIVGLCNRDRRPLKPLFYGDFPGDFPGDLSGDLEGDLEGDLGWAASHVSAILRSRTIYVTSRKWFIGVLGERV